MRLIRTASGLQKVLEEVEAVQHGHFHLSSGYHSNRYVQCAKALQNPQIAEDIATFLVHKATESIPFVPFGVEYVIGPAMGGLIIGHEVARQLGSKFIFTERTDGRVEFRRGFHIHRGSRVLIVEDVVTTGKSTREVLDVCHVAGANVVGVMSIIDRTTENMDFGVPFVAGAWIEAATYNPVLNACPMCLSGEDLVKPGSRR